MKRGRAAHAVERALDRLDRVGARLLGSGLQVRLVDLDDVGPRREQIADLRVNRLSERERQRTPVVIVLIDSLLRHRERPRNRHLRLPIGRPAQELDVADLDRPRRRTGPTTRGT